MAAGLQRKSFCCLYAKDCSVKPVQKFNKVFKVYSPKQNCQQQINIHYWQLTIYYNLFSNHIIYTHFTGAKQQKRNIT